MRRLLSIIVFAMICGYGACAALAENVRIVRATPRDPQEHRLDTVAENYVKLVLAVGQHSSDFVDAYFGPPAWQAEAAANGGRPLSELTGEAGRLLAAVGAMAVEPADTDRSLRRDFLTGQLAATRAYITILVGKKLSFDEEAKALYGVEPPHDDLASFERIQAQLAALLPGEGPVAARYEAWRRRLIVPATKIAALFEAAAKEAKRRTAAHAQLPAGESFDLSVVTGKPWGAYNWYRGEARSLIEVNADVPFFLERAIDFAAHEGYPGHHVFMALQESNLFRKRGQVEHAIYPLFSPLSLISEGSAQAGIRLAFPEAERLAFERDVLFPLAGLPPDEATRYAEIRRLVKGLEKADVTLARRLLDGAMSEAQVKDWLLTYGLRTTEEADKAVEFFRAYRSYVVNYSVGEDLVTQWLDRRAGKDLTKRWTAFIDLITSPRLPAALQFLKAPAVGGQGSDR
jgi:hypothetical protein